MITETLLGVLTGFAGNIVTSFTNLKAQKLKNAHEVAMLAAQTEATIKEAEANIRITETQIAGEIEKAETAAYLESMKQSTGESANKLVEKLLTGNKFSVWVGMLLTFLLGIVDFLKGLVRPGLTIYLVALTTVISSQAWEIMGAHQEALTALEAKAIYMEVINIVIYLTVSVVTWWFGDRRTAKFLYRLNDGNLRN